MSPLPRIERAVSAMKVFPLPSASLFPSTAQPFHIFEPRYLELVRDALASDQVIALAQLEPGFEATYAGRPSIRPVVCAGVISGHEELEDGKFNIIVQGMVRARMIRELPPRTGYREISVELLPDAAVRYEEEELLRQTVLELGARLPSAVSQPLLQAAAHARGGALADVVASAVISDGGRRQALLEELDVRKRLVQVLWDVGEVIARLSPLKPDGFVH